MDSWTPSAALHCMVCCREISVSSVSKTCGDECRKIFKRLRRAARSVRCRVTLMGTRKGSFVCWLPLAFLRRRDKGVSGPSGTRRRKKPGRPGVSA